MIFLTSCNIGSVNFLTKSLTCWSYWKDSKQVQEVVSTTSDDLHSLPLPANPSWCTCTASSNFRRSIPTCGSRECDHRPSFGFDRTPPEIGGRLQIPSELHRSLSLVCQGWSGILVRSHLRRRWQRQPAPPWHRIPCLEKY